MLACRRCGGDDTKAVVEEPNPPATDRKQGLKKVRECVSCRARAGTTERWSDDDDSAEYYRAKCEQAAEWIGKLALLLKAPSATARMTEDWIRKDLDRHTAGAGSGRAGGGGHFVSTDQKKNRKGPELLKQRPTPLSGVLEAGGASPGRGRSRGCGFQEKHRRTEESTRGDRPRVNTPP